MTKLKKSLSSFLNTRKLHPVAVRDGDPVKILFTDDHATFDITGNHALISLKPFAIAVNAAAIQQSNDEKPMLRVMNGELLLGVLHLKSKTVRNFNGLTLLVFEADLSGNPMSFFSVAWNSFLLYVKNKTNIQSQNFVVQPKELLKLFVYSLKPRPVFIASVQHENGFDAFPIDIAGNLSATQRLLSIRSTSGAIPHILATKRICAAAVPWEQRHAAYRLGSYHAGAVVPKDLEALGFIASPQWGIPVPAFALGVEELGLEHTFQKGVHTQFIFRVSGRYQLADGMQLAHTPWFNKNYFKNSFELSK